VVGSGTATDAVIEAMPRDRDFYLVPVFEHDNVRLLNEFAEFLDFKSGLVASGRAEILRQFNNGDQVLASGGARKLREGVDDDDDESEDEELHIWDES
jgi:hypothetical protein